MSYNKNKPTKVTGCCQTTARDCCQENSVAEEILQAEDKPLIELLGEAGEAEADGLGPEDVSAAQDSPKDDSPKEDIESAE